jgi:hypothetical protein
MPRKIISILTIFPLFFCFAETVKALSIEEKIRLEADYILACQYIDPVNPAHGAINDITGYPTWVVPRENGMAILGLIVAQQVLGDNLYLTRAELAADYLVRIQDQADGAWCNHYNYTQVVDSAKSPTQTAEVILALAKLGYRHDRYDAVKKGAEYLISCQDIANIGGQDHGLLGGGKDALGQYYGWRWASDNSYAYWALKACEFWANIEDDSLFAGVCAEAAEKIITGINTYLFNPATGVWYIAIDGDGVSQGNPDLPAPYNNLPGWINYAPQMLDLPVNGVNLPSVGDWIKDSFQQADGSCIGYLWQDSQLKIKKYPGLSFQASLCWYDTDQIPYADAAMNWAENSGLWQIIPDPNNVIGGWIDWVEVQPNPGLVEDWWFRFIDTSFYSIAHWNGGYDFRTYPWMLRLLTPYYQQEELYYSAAASSKMILDYIREDDILTQDELYTYGHTHNHPDNYSILDIDPQGVKATLNNYRPLGYNFSIRALNNFIDLARDVCHWLDYEVGGVDIIHVPLALPAYGDYSNWMVVRGAAAEKDPSSTNTFNVYGFWINDPSVSGIGQNSYKTADECQDNYFVSLDTADPWDGKYVAVAEPPAKLSQAKIKIAEPISNTYTHEFIRIISLLESRNKLTKSLEQRITKIDWRQIIDPYLMQDISFRDAFRKTKARIPVKVKTLNAKFKDYYLVAFDKVINGKIVTSVVIILDAADGHFKEASWTTGKNIYLPVDKDKAINRVLNNYRSTIYPIKTKITAELLWQPGAKSPTPYLPFWKVSVNGRSLYVYQDGSISELINYQR